ncbi:MAG: prenyltransferase [Actinobacteria bacterium]|nr:prenyltransferase [Actinomycetota bacterium]
MTKAEDLAALLASADRNGGPWWSRTDGNIHAPAGFSTLLVLRTLPDLGATLANTPALNEAVDLVLSFQNDDGSFRYSAHASRLPCITGEALAGLGRLGVNDPGIDAGYKWLAESVAADGGWRCPTMKPGTSPATDLSNPGATLFALDALRFRPDTPDEVTAPAVAALLHHWDTRAPQGPCHFGIGKRFLKVEYPFKRYNIFYWVYVLSHYEQAVADPRFQAAFDALRSTTVGDRFTIEAPNRAWAAFGFARGGAPSDVASELWRQTCQRVQPPR